MTGIAFEITQYGKGTNIGGWDKYFDRYSNVFTGDKGTILSGVHCALTDSARQALNAVDGDWIEITFATGEVYIRRVGDRAPEDNPRIDFFNYFAFDEQMDKLGMYASARKIIFN